MPEETQEESIKKRLIQELTSVLAAKEDLAEYSDAIKRELNTTKDECLKKIQEAKQTFAGTTTNIISGVASKLETLEDAANTNINNAITAFNEKSDANIASQGLKFKELHDKVSGLLPHAAVESIAYSYDASAKRHEVDVEKWNRVFFGALFAMFLVPIFVSFIFSIKMSNASTADLLNIVLRSIPFEAPVIWLAVYAAKQGKKAKRLLEEYAYKYTTATTFIGMQKTIFEQNSRYKMFTLEAQNQQDLNRKFVNSIFENPSLTLENCVSADMPMEELAPLLDKVGPENVKLLLETVGKTVGKSS